jgi:acyl carrier protein
MSEVGDRLKKVVAEHLGVDVTKVVEDASFVEDLGADSLDAIELAMLFGDEFGCDIPDPPGAEFATVKEAVTFIETQLAGKR